MTPRSTRIAGRGGVLAGVDGQAELELGVDRVEAPVLEPVGAQLLGEADAATLVPAQVDDHPALGGHPLERAVELRPAVAALRAEHVAGEALGVHPHERRPALGALAG